MTARAMVCATARPRTEIRRDAPASDASQPTGPCSRTDAVVGSSSDRRFAPPFGWGEETMASSPAAVGTMGSTLENLIQRLWEGLWAGGAPCPLCGGQLRLDRGCGRCNSCGSALF